MSKSPTVIINLPEDPIQADSAWLCLLLTLRPAGLAGKALAWAERRNLNRLGDVLDALGSKKCKAAGRKTQENIKSLAHQYGIAWPVRLNGWNTAWADKMSLRFSTDLRDLAMLAHNARFPDRKHLLESEYDIMLTYSELVGSHASVVRKCLGLESAPPVTLQAAGSDVDITRERMRQLVSQFLATIQILPQEFFPVFYRTHHLLQAGEGPALVAEVGDWLRDRSLTDTGVSGEGLLKLMRQLTLPLPPGFDLLQTGGGKRDRLVFNLVRQLMRRESAQCGAMERSDLLSRLNTENPSLHVVPKDLNAVLLRLEAQALQQGLWLRLATAKRDMLVNVLSKLGTLGRAIPMDELYAAWLCAYKRKLSLGRKAIPAEVFTEIVTEMPDWTESSHGWLYTGPAGRLTPFELALKDILTQNQKLSRKALVHILREPPHSFKDTHVAVYLSTTALLVAEASGLYRLVGNSVVRS